jgi:hypothetical protein
MGLFQRKSFNPNGRPQINLSESEIKYAIDNTKSSAQAARFLRVSPSTFKKYASIYKNPETGKTWYETSNNKTGIGVFRTPKKSDFFSDLKEVLEGKRSTKNKTHFKKRLFMSGIVQEKCCLCGHEERRLTDGASALILDFRDGNTDNQKLENIRVLCYNCYFVNVGNFIGPKNF